MTVLIEEFTFIVLYMVFRVLFTLFGEDEGFERVIVVSVAFAACALSLWGMLQYFLDFDVPSGLKMLFKTHHFPVIASMGNPNFLAEYLTLSLPVAVCGMYFFRPSWILIPVIMVIGSTVFLTYSRLAWVIFLFSMIILLVPAPREKRKLLAVAFTAVLVFSGSLFIHHWKTGSSRAQRIVNSFSSSREAPLFERSVLYASAVAMLKDAGITGMGPGMFGYRYIDYQGETVRRNPAAFNVRHLVDLDHAHADILEIGIDAGYPAMIAYIMLLGFTSMRGVTMFRSGQVRGVLQCLMLLPAVFLLFSSLSFPFYIPASRQLLYLGLAFVASRCRTVRVCKANARPMVVFCIPVLAMYTWLNVAYIASFYHNEKGLECFRRDPVCALSRFSSGIRAYPYNGYNYFSMGALLLNEGSPYGLLYLEESLSCLRNSSTFLYLARGYREHGRIDEAGRWYRYITMLRPDMTDALREYEEIIDGE